MKRLVVCCDGTWQDLSKEYPTNVVKMAQAVKTIGSPIEPQGKPVLQLVFYGQGIGSGGRLLNRIGGGAFGWGIDENIQDAYRFLCLNYDPGDEIYLFGFSRGAYTVRSLAGLIRCAGGLLPRDELRRTPIVYDIYRSEKFKDNQQDLRRKEQEMKELYKELRSPMRTGVHITLLGCWDTVGALGIPQTIPLLPKGINKKYQFHDCQLSNIIDHALHAVAIDEQRKAFDVTPMEQSQENKDAGQEIRQVWFPGDHGCVGGGTRSVQGLSDGALAWMIEQMEKMGLGLELDPSLVECDLKSDDPKKHYGIHPDCNVEFDNTPRIPLVPQPINSLARGLKLIRPFERKITGTFEDLHSSVIKRWQYSAAKYRPSNIPPRYVAQLNTSSFT